MKGRYSVVKNRICFFGGMVPSNVSSDILLELVKIGLTAILSGGVAIVATIIANRNNNRRMLLEFQERDKRAQRDFQLEHLQKLFEDVDGYAARFNEYCNEVERLLVKGSISEPKIDKFLYDNVEAQRTLSLGVRMRIKLYFPQLDNEFTLIAAKLRQFNGFVEQVLLIDNNDILGRNSLRSINHEIIKDLSILFNKLSDGIVSEKNKLITPSNEATKTSR